MQKNHEDMKAAQEKLSSALKNNASDEELLSLFDSLDQKRRDMGKYRFNQILGIRKVLTPEQQKIFMEKNPFGHQRPGQRGQGKFNRGQMGPGNQNMPGQGQQGGFTPQGPGPDNMPPPEDEGF